MAGIVTMGKMAIFVCPKKSYFMLASCVGHLLLKGTVLFLLALNLKVNKTGLNPAL
jgi:hypothetical protein